MTTLRKKKEFKKGLKKENNKTSKKKLRKRSKNKISKKKKLVAGSKFGGMNNSLNNQLYDARKIVLQRHNSGTREPLEIYKVLTTIGRKFINDYNRSASLSTLENLEINERGTRISPKDDSVYLEITINTSQGYQQLFHLSDHPGPSGSGCGAIHIKQLRSFDGLTQYDPPRCFTITTKENYNNKLTLIDNSNSNDNNENFEILKSLIENITEQDVIDLGLYTRPNRENLPPFTPPNNKIQSRDPSSIDTHTGLTPIKSLNFESVVTNSEY